MPLSSCEFRLVILTFGSFELSKRGKHQVLAPLERMKKEIDTEFNPDGYNVGINM
jgi:diadenosine tetraphosphate (Ap4A) HIT family hydrolase